MDVKIPEDKMFAPPINVRVYDDRLLNKPLLATRSIPIVPFIPWGEDNKLAIQAAGEQMPEKVEGIPGAAFIKEQKEVKKHFVLSSFPSFALIFLLL